LTISENENVLKGSTSLEHRKQLITVDGKMYRITVEIPPGIWKDPRLEVEYIGESTEIQKLVTNDLA
jgi:hypothetical protein